MAYLPDLFENLAGQVDGVVALDDQSTDGSAEFVERQRSVLKLLRVAPGAQEELEDGRNHRRLTEAAWEFDADWLLGIDADERVERDFRRRANAEITGAEAAGRSALWVHVREIWDDPTTFRADGIWGQKRKICLFKSSRDHEFHDARVHAMWASMPPPPGDWPQADLLLYHLRMLRTPDRAARAARYERIDPDHVWQEIGYDYLLDDTSLRLEPIQPGRGYFPLPVDQGNVGR